MKEYAEDTPVLENNSINIDLVQYWKRLKSRWKSILNLLFQGATL